MFLISREDFLKPGLLSSAHASQNSYKSHLYEAGKDRKSIENDTSYSSDLGTRMKVASFLHTKYQPELPWKCLLAVCPGKKAKLVNN